MVSVTCHLTVFYVMAYLFLKSILLCWLAEIVEYLFGGSPSPWSQKDCKNGMQNLWNISETIFAFKCEFISSQNSWLTIGMEISGK